MKISVTQPDDNNQTTLVSETRGSIKNRISIDNRRPAIFLDTRARLGNWEANTIISKNHKQAMVTIVERKTGLVKIKKVTYKGASIVIGVISDIPRPLTLFVKTITSDNGKEFANHQRVKRDLHAMFYFADTYASWQRGFNKILMGSLESICLKVATLLRSVMMKFSSLKIDSASDQDRD